MKYEDEEKGGKEEMDEAADESRGHGKFGPERHGVSSKDWPKKFVVDGGLEYDFGGGEHGKPEEYGNGKGAPGKTHEYDRSAGKIKGNLPKKFKTDGRGGFDGGEGEGGGVED